MSEKQLAVIDDDEAVRDSLIWLFDGQGFQTTGFDSAEAFLAGPGPAAFNVLIVDLRLSGISGIVLLERLAEHPYCPPVIMLTAHGDVPHAVAALKLGAIDFMEKPFDDSRLLAMVDQALLRDQQERDRFGRLSRLNQSLALLTEREREVMQLILVGKLNKQIADELAISMKTVEVHRSRVFDKMGVKSAVELAGLMAALDKPDAGSKG
jgi:two-component system response regulator DctR